MDSGTHQYDMPQSDEPQHIGYAYCHMTQTTAAMAQNNHKY